MKNSRLPNVGTTIFTTVSALAAEQGAINLGQGFPDYDGPQYLRERLTHHVMTGNNQYAPMAGILELRQQISTKVQTLYQRSVDPVSEVTVLPGATVALFAAIMATVQTGDEVIVFDPAYDSYEPGIQMAGGKAVHIPLSAPHFAIDWQRVKDSITSRTRMIVLNSPHNPTGATLSADDLDELARLVRGTDILLLSDEVYEHLVFDGEQHQSLLRHAELADRAFVVSSFGKTYHVTGWKTGYCIAPAALTAELRKIHQFVTFVGVTPIQLALSDMMREHPDHCAELAAFYQAKRDRFVRALAGSKFKIEPASGSFFQLVDYSDVSDMGDMAMAQWLTREVKVAAIPISVFYEQAPKQHFIRFCFAKQDATLQEAAERLRAHC
ncbi:MAG: pyridoxal phosphate-dependent aminotransferase [Pseudomonadales bacterium]